MVWADGGGEPFTLGSFGQTDVRVAAITGTECLRGTESDCEFFVSRYNMESGQPESLRISGDGSPATSTPTAPSSPCVTRPTRAWSSGSPSSTT